MNVTKRSHFVFEYYLQNWATDKLIYVSMNSNSPFQVSVENIANKRYFYKVTPFNKFEKQLLINTIKGGLRYIFLFQQFFHK